ncbi:RNA polymerase sigma factor [Pseudoflavitalea rhizosphaerae]|uniref:RNA polymerase sigma factor n=1 Tax=Pseudoflavitalea rhizosphaerae TaxID=1884793 RepID=UPI000F8E0E77|nr:sigma-70 family RNA polymerase sigma factor [Pseudoflavitalea rhizosphaerae]
MAADPTYDENELLQAVVKGYETAFRELMSRYWDKMYSNILYHCKQQELAEELTQDLFVTVWQKREQLPQIRQFDAWLFAIAKNLVLGAFRKKVLPLLDTGTFDPLFQDDGLTGIDLLELKELHAVLNNEIAQLPPQLQRAFTLHRIQGLSHEEVAAQMNISRFSSQTYVARATIMLRTALSKYSGKAGFSFFLLFL